MNNTSIKSNSESVAICNRLLKGEVSAVETYDKAIRLFEGRPNVNVLDNLKDRHLRTLEQLSENIRSAGGEPTTESGGWGLLANSIQSAANLLGKGSAIESLLRGEKLGKQLYDEALQNDQLLPESRDLISYTLLPRIVENIVILRTIEETRDE